MKNSFGMPVKMEKLKKLQNYFKMNKLTLIGKFKMIIYQHLFILLVGKDILIL